MLWYPEIILVLCPYIKKFLHFVTLSFEHKVPSLLEDDPPTIPGYYQRDALKVGGGVLLVGGLITGILRYVEFYSPYLLFLFVGSCTICMMLSWLHFQQNIGILL